MGYRDRLLEICKTGDWDAALDFLRSIFHAPVSQTIKGTPSDFLDEDREQKVTAAEGFDQLVEGFRPRESLERRVKFVVERLAEGREHDELRHAFTPFNTLVFVVDDYERCSVTIDSMHDRDGEWVRQFGLDHEIVRPGDSHEEYTFTYDLEFNSDQYSFFYDGQPVSGTLLHHDTKLVIFARWLVKLVDKLIDNPEFAAFPKSLPFHHVIVGAAGHQEPVRPPFRVALVPPVTEATLEHRHTREAWLAAAKPQGDTGVDSRFIYLLPNMADPTSAEGVELVTLVREHPHLRAIIHQLAEASLDEASEMKPGEGLLRRAQEVCARFGPLAFARLLSALGDVDVAVAHRRKVLRLPLPTKWGEGRHDALDVAHHHISRVFGTWATASEQERAALEPDWNAALAALRTAGETEPFVRILLVEREAAPRIDANGRGVDDDKAPAVQRAPEVDASDDLFSIDDDDEDNFDSKTDDEPWPGSWLELELRRFPRYLRALCENPPPGYVDALRAAIRAFESTYFGYGGPFELIQHRLFALGPRAKDAAADLLVWAAKWAGGRGTADEQFANYLGKMLMAIGVEDVPEFVHASARRNKYMVEDFYPRWAAAVPTRRVDAFVESFRANPEKFERADAWDELIYDSPPGLEMFITAIIGSKKPPRVDREDALARLSKAAPAAGPLLTKLVYQLADRLEKKSLRAARTLLEEMPVLDPPRRALLRRARISDVIAAVDARTPDAAAVTSRLADQYPGDALVTFVSARQLVSESPDAAAELVRTALRSFSASDIVYRKAIFQLAGLPLDAWKDLDLATSYAILQIAIDRFRGEHYDGNVVTSGFESDPFYDALADRLAALTPDAIARELEGWRTHLGFDAKLREVPDAELAKHIDVSKWQTTWVIAHRLAKGDEPWRLECLLQVWREVAADESHRRALTDLIWAQEAWRTAFITDERVTPHFGWLIEHVPCNAHLDTVRTVCATLLAADQPRTVVELAQQLDHRLVTSAFLSIFPAYQRLGDWDGMIALLEKVRAETSPKKPDYVLLTSNIAVGQIHADRVGDAERTLDALFAMDWARFDYRPNADGFALALGSGLDAQLAAVFRTYMGMAKFNAACLYARTGRTAHAISTLHEAVTLNPEGYPAEKILAESDFAPIRDDAGFTQLISSLEGAA
ncbi:MAG TPA: hypothetical protein VK427_11520 [Kofleriaceae bacterium]|nr:hypothetical protein [Kofleriaceae bacterium]